MSDKPFPNRRTIPLSAEAKEQHQIWLTTDGKRGKRLELASVHLQQLKGENLRRVNAQGADLKGADLTGTILYEADLQDANLTDAKGLLNGQLGGANLCGAKLPEAVAKFDGLNLVKDLSTNAGKIFVSVLAFCAFAMITILKTHDAQLFTNSGTTKLPLVDAEISIFFFFLIAPLALLGMYLYFHLSLQRLWEALADLPAVFPDGRRLDQRTFPWLLNDLVRNHFWHLRDKQPDLARPQYWLSIFLAWCLIPLSLVFFWSRYLVRRDLSMTLFHIGVLTAAIWFGLRLYHLAKATLRKDLTWRKLEMTAWKNPRVYVQVGVAAIAGGILLLFSLALQWGIMPGGTFGRHSSGLPSDVVSLATRVHFLPVANFVREDVSSKPAGWTGAKPEDMAAVRGAEMEGQDLRYAQANGSFLVKGLLGRTNLYKADLRKADLRQADLTKAWLTGAHLEGAHLEGANLEGTNLAGVYLAGTHLEGLHLEDANLGGVNLRGTDLSGAHLEGAHLERANLEGAGLKEADLSRADLEEANLRGTDLSGAHLEEANLRRTDLSGADLEGAHLGGANLRGTDLSGADLEGANLRRTDLSGADLGEANLRGTDLSGADLSGADLERANLDRAHYDSATRFTHGFNSKAHGMSLDNRF